MARGPDKTVSSKPDMQGQEGEGISFPTPSVGIGSLTRADLREKAEEIVNRLDREESLVSDVKSHPVSPNSLSPYHTYHHSPISLQSSHSTSHQVVPHDDEGQQMMLSPIVESPGMEDTFPRHSLAKTPLLHHSGELPQFSSYGDSALRYGKFDGPGLGTHTQCSHPPIDEDDLSVKKQAAYPKQTLLYPLNPVSMCTYMYMYCDVHVYIRILLPYIIL